MKPDWPIRCGAAMAVAVFLLGPAACKNKPPEPARPAAEQKAAIPAADEKSSEEQALAAQHRREERKDAERAASLTARRLERVKNYLAKGVAKFDVLAALLEEAEQKAAAAGSEEAAKKTADLRRRFNEAGAEQFKKRLQDLDQKTGRLIERCADPPASMTTKGLLSAEAEVRGEFGRISREIKDAGMPELDRDIRRLAAELGVKGPDFSRPGPPPGMSPGAAAK